MHINISKPTWRFLDDRIMAVKFENLYEQVPCQWYAFGQYTDLQIENEGEEWVPIAGQFQTGSMM